MNLVAREFSLTSRRCFGLFAVMLGFLVLANGCHAQTNRGQNQQTTEDSLIGVWESDEATVEIRPDGTLSINGDRYKYKVKGKIIFVTGDEGSMNFPFKLEGNRLIVSVDGRLVVYKRLSEKIGEKAEDEGTSRRAAGGGGIALELVGKWCYLSNMTGSNSRMSNRCFTLYEDGTYEYYSENSTSGANGSTVSQESDSGRWSVSGNTIIANSNANGRMVYPFEKRNHPKTGDPMIVLDGDAYVTAYQKNPW